MLSSIFILNLYFHFSAFDSDSNDSISFTDFVVCYSITSFGNLEQKITLAFKIYDIDKNNVIDKHEMLKVLETLFDLTGISEAERKEKSPKKIVELIMKKLDKNGDNVIQIKEFVDGCIADEMICSVLIDPMFNC
jgi:Ca2+-binding EF-hand superfamily protein